MNKAPSHLAYDLKVFTLHTVLYCSQYRETLIYIPCRDGSNEGHTVLCSALSPLVSGGGPVSDCSLCHIPGKSSSQPFLSQVGNDRSGPDNNTVQCHTDLSTCCYGGVGIHRAHNTPQD